MKEIEVSIPISDGTLLIHGILRGDYTQPLVVLCHGYGGWMNEMLLYNGARAFEKHGFATLRLSMYGGGENSRNISESDLLTHAQDIDQVVAFVKENGNSWVGVVGHSFSGMAIIYCTDQGFDAVALWDPTHSDGYDTPEAKAGLKDYLFVHELNAYVSGMGSGYIYAKSVFDNDYLKSNDAAAHFKVNTAIFNASWSKAQQAYGKQYAASIAAETEQVVIPDSSHPFTEDGAAEKLFNKTAEYFKTQLKT